jgi:hypothetical protein
MSGGGELKKLLLSAYSSVIPPRSATYCSTPITSGKYYFDWLARAGKRFDDVDGLESEARGSHLLEVIHANRSHSQKVVARLRQDHSYVIDPAAVANLPGWKQADWLTFWEEVIAIHALEVVFVDGWEYSYGCSHEFWFAKSKDLLTYDERHNPLSRSQGSEMIRRAAREIQSKGGPVNRLESILSALEELPE